MELGMVLEPSLRADEAAFLGGEEDHHDRALRPGARGGDEAESLEAGGETRAVVDAARPAAEAVEVAAHDDVLIGILPPAERGHDAVVLDRAHLEPIPDVELELRLLALLDQGFDLVVLIFGQLDVGQLRQLVPRLDEAVHDAERLGLGRLDGAQRAGFEHGFGQGRHQDGFRIVLGVPAAVPGEAGVVAGDEDPGILVGGLVRVDLGDRRLDGLPLFLKVLGGGVPARDRVRIGFQDDDSAALRALGAGRIAGRPEEERLLRRLDHLAEPRATVEADGHLARLVEVGLEAELLELPDRPLGGVGVGVGARLPAAEPVAGVIVPAHDLVVGRAELDDLLDDGILRPAGRGLGADERRGEQHPSDEEYQAAFFHRSSGRDAFEGRIICPPRPPVNKQPTRRVLSSTRPTALAHHPIWRVPFASAGGAPRSAPPVGPLP